MAKTLRTKARGATVADPAVGPEPYRPPYLAATIATIAVFLLYAVTLAPTTQFWDTSEYIATAHILGIPHPPGNPLFVVLARTWDVLLSPTGLPVAVRINLFSATMGALAHGCWFLVVHRILSFFSENRAVRLTGAAVAVLLSATAFTVWNQSNVNEKVYTVSLFTIALLTWLAFRWRDATEGRLGEHLGRGEDNLLLLMVFILALSVGNHLMAFLAAPAMLVFVLMVRPRALLSWRLYAGVAVFALVGLSIHLFLPLRASLDPIINEADPSTWKGLLDSLARKQYQKPSMFSNPVFPGLPRDPRLLGAQVVNYFQYFDWQWARSVAGLTSFFGGLRPVMTLVMLLLGGFGAWTHRQRDRKSWVYLTLLFVTLSAGLVFYLNFKYGFTYPAHAIPPGATDPQEVRERDYFFIGSFSVWGLWAGIGLTALWQRLALRWQLVSSTRRPRHLLATAPLLGFALLPLVLNWHWASRAGDYFARDWAYNLLMSVEPYGVLFTNGDNDTFPLWYLQEVEGIRRDVTVIVTSYLNTAWYAKQLRQLTTPCPPGVNPEQDPTRNLCQRPYNAVQGPAPYADLATPPNDTILPLSDDQIDQIAATPFITDRDLPLRADSLETTIPAGTELLPAQTFITVILKAALGKRPIQFTTPSPPTLTLHLFPFVVRQGLTFKLHDGPVHADPSAGIYALPRNTLSDVTGPFIDLPLTQMLAEKVFVQHGGLPDRQTRPWVDSSTRNLPSNYAWMYAATSQALGTTGNNDAAQQELDRAGVWMSLVN